MAFNLEDYTVIATFGNHKQSVNALLKVGEK